MKFPKSTKHYAKRRNHRVRKYHRKKVSGDKQIYKKQMQGGTTYVINRQPRERPLIVSKSSIAAQIAVGAGTSYSQTFLFDPSNTFIPSGWSSIGIPEWASYVGLYDQYKVYKIDVIASIASSTGISNASEVIMYGRYQYDNQFPTVPALTDMSKLKNVKVHYFTPEHPSISYSVYPREKDLVFNTTGQTSTGTAKEIRKPRWVDIDNPATFLGFSFFIPHIPTGTSVQFDVVYHMGFKYQV